MKRRARDEGGATAVEFGLIMLPLIYLVFGIIQYGLYFYASNAGTNAVGDAVRRLTVGDCQDKDELRAYISDRLGGSSPAGPGDLEFFKKDKTTGADGPVFYDNTGTEITTPAVGGQVVLTVKYPAVNMHFPFIPLPDDGEVTRQIFGRMEDTVPTGGGCS